GTDVDGVAARELDAVPAVGVEGALDRGTVNGPQRGLDLGHELADARSERAEVGNHHVVDQAFETRDALDLAYVQRVPDLLGHRAAEASPVGEQAQCAPKRRPDLEARLAARRQPQ